MPVSGYYEWHDTPEGKQAYYFTRRDGQVISFELAPMASRSNCVAPGRINSVQIPERLHPTEALRQAFKRSAKLAIFVLFACSHVLDLR